MADRVRTKRRANRALFQVTNGCRKRAAAELEREVVRRLLIETSLDVALILDPGVDGGCRIHAVINHNGHGAPDVLLRERPEAPSGIGRKAEIHLPGAGPVAIAGFRRASQIASGDNGGAVQQPPVLAAALAGRGLTPD